jgi:hypothetical protein
MKKLFLSFIAVSALTLASCDKGESKVEAPAEKAEASESSEEAAAEETAAEADSLNAETAE